jgi:hypothetical protein
MHISWQWVSFFILSIITHADRALAPASQSSAQPQDENATFLKALVGLPCFRG